MIIFKSLLVSRPPVYNNRFSNFPKLFFKDEFDHTIATTNTANITDTATTNGHFSNAKLNNQVRK